MRFRKLETYEGEVWVDLDRIDAIGPTSTGVHTTISVGANTYNVRMGMKALLAIVQDHVEPGPVATPMPDETRIRLDELERMLMSLSCAPGVTSYWHRRRAELGQRT